MSFGLKDVGEILHLVFLKTKKRVATLVTTPFSLWSISDLNPGFSKIFDFDKNPRTLEKLRNRRFLFFGAAHHLTAYLFLIEKLFPKEILLVWLFNCYKIVLCHKLEHTRGAVNIFQHSFKLQCLRPGFTLFKGK